MKKLTFEDYLPAIVALRKLQAEGNIRLDRHHEEQERIRAAIFAALSEDERKKLAEERSHLNG